LNQDFAGASSDGISERSLKRLKKLGDTLRQRKGDGKEENSIKINFPKKSQEEKGIYS